MLANFLRASKLYLDIYKTFLQPFIKPNILLLFLSRDFDKMIFTINDIK